MDLIGGCRVSLRKGYVINCQVSVNALLTARVHDRHVPLFRVYEQTHTRVHGDENLKETEKVYEEEEETA